jgi:hypothetical protein
MICYRNLLLIQEKSDLLHQQLHGLVAFELFLLHLKRLDTIGFPSTLKTDRDGFDQP